MIEDTEIWRPVPCFPELEIEASSLGQLRMKGRFLNQWVNDGYCMVKLKVGEKWDCFLAHRLVCSAFHKIPDDIKESDHFNFRDGVPHVVNHKNGIKHDNRSSNVEWTSHESNINHALDNDLCGYNFQIILRDTLENKAIKFRSVLETARYLKIQPAMVLFFCNIHKTNPYKNRYLFEVFDEERLLSEIVNVREKEIIVRDYRNNVTTVYKSISNASFLLGVPRTVIVKDLRRYNDLSKDKLTNGYVFRTMDRALLAWPSYEENEVNASISMWRKHIDKVQNPFKKNAIALSLKTKEEKLFPSLKVAVYTCNLKPKYNSIVRRFRSGMKIVTMGDFVFKYAEIYP